MKRSMLALAFLLTLLPGCRTQAETLDGVTHEVAFRDLRFRRPLWIGHAGDGTDRLFVVEQAGTIYVFPNDPEVREPELVLDHRHIVRRRHNEEGLLGLAFHPDFAENGQVFLHYSASEPRRNVVSRMLANDERTAFRPETEVVLLEVEQPYGNHNGGDLRFGPDGYLYISLGDGGSGGDPEGNGQNLGTLLGAILRIDVDNSDGNRAYAIPADNPFVGQDGAREEIWAWGLRNVWRMSFDRVTGQLWAGDVGQDSWEEIDLVKRGRNYGWNLREGMHRYRDGAASGELTDPVVEHGRHEAKSITGGFVYRGSKIPELRGAYVYGDYVTGNLWALWEKDGEVERHVALGAARTVASFGEDRDGELYFCSFDGRIHRIVPETEKSDR